MPPALKVLSLVTTILCVVLLFGMFALDEHISYESNRPQFSFKKVQRQKSNLNPSATTSQSMTTGSVGRSMYSNIVEPSSGGRYVDYSVISTTTVDISTLNRLGGNYYKDHNSVYYLSEQQEVCGDSVKTVAIHLPFSLPERVTEAQWGNFLTDGKDVYLFFSKVDGVDPSTFTFVGFADHTRNEQDEVNTYWYKDKNKVFAFVYKKDGCRGEYFYEETSDGIKAADAGTFEYITPPATDMRYFYAKDKKFFYAKNGPLSDVITPLNCTGNFFTECLPRIQNATSTASTTTLE